MQELFWVFGTAGLTWMITRHHWMKSFREWASKHKGLIDDLFNCYYCVGAWSGAITYLLLDNPFTIWIPTVFAGAAISLIFIETILKLQR